MSFDVNNCSGVVLDDAGSNVPEKLFPVVFAPMGSKMIHR